MVGYDTAHYRVRADRGPASAHKCVDCDRPAQYWSYNSQDPDELVENGKAYSLDQSFYQPRCLSCCRRKAARRKALASYHAVHLRLRRDRGPASDYACVSCGGPAQHWSYDHQDPDELTEDSGPCKGLPYSLNQSAYQPRCVSCHNVFDLRFITEVRAAAWLAEQRALLAV